MGSFQFYACDVRISLLSHYVHKSVGHYPCFLCSKLSSGDSAPRYKLHNRNSLTLISLWLFFPSFRDQGILPALLLPSLIGTSLLSFEHLIPKVVYRQGSAILHSIEYLEFYSSTNIGVYITFIERKTNLAIL